MGDPYQYPVFFECPSLDGEQLKRIENYFHIRRKSGGGECGSVTKTNDKVYSIAFKEREAQQRVLEICEHMLEFAGGSLVLTVRGSPGPRSSFPTTTSTPGQAVSAKLDLTSSQKQQSVPASTPPPSGEEYELRPDTYLLHYLQECPEAGEELEKEFASVSCSAQLYPEEGRVLVKSLAQPGVVDEGRNWKAEVDKLFDAYLCHYEVDPHKVKALLQSCSSHQTTDEVKVYSEGGLVVVVGKRSQVKARLMDVVDLTVKHRGTHSIKRQTSIRRLGEAKLRLLWKEIEHGVGRNFPGVKVTQGDAGQVVLEGSVEDILKAGDWISEKENLVLERTVSNMSPHLLAYGGPGMLGDFLGVGDEVEIELRGAELRVFSLSADKLDDAEKALQGEFKEVKINLPTCSAVPSELQEKLMSKKNEMPSLSLSEGNTLVASYSLCDGLQVLLCQGDITKQDADALVNAANEDLDHCGGVAAALSKAGGPEIQRESSALVKQIGKIPTGDVMVTTGGKLNCKTLLHAVGPAAGRAGGRERFLLEKTVQSALNMAEIMELKSIAMPCISSGVFGVPLTVCSEAIVTAVKRFGSQGGRSLRRIILIDNRGEVVRAMQEACDRLLQGISTKNTTLSDLEYLMGAAAQDTSRGATAGAPGDGVHFEVVQGTIETQQVDALVSPMAGHDPLTTRVGNILSSVVGSQLIEKFYKDAGGATLPGEIVLVEGLSALQSKAVIFLNLLSWDNDQNGTAVKVLRKSIRQILASCGIRGFTSVALPMLGTGAVLRFPHSVASRVLLEEVQAFEQNRISTSSFRVRVVIHPNDKESSKTFQSAQETLRLRGFTNDANPDQASFYRHVSVTTDEVTAMLGRVKLQMVHGDIVNEATDIIVNTTDFTNNQSGVSKAILTAAGPVVQAELARVGIPTDLMCTTGPGLLGCREIIHASFKRDPQLIRKNCKKILKQCESKGYHSVALPAINTGVAGMDSVKACKAILDGITTAIRDLKLNSLALIRIVILQQPVFQAFRSELENRFGQTIPCRFNLREKAKQKLKEWQEKYSKTPAPSATQGETFISSKPQPAVLTVICNGSDIITTVKSDLEGILQKQLVDRVVNVHDFSSLDAMELEAVLTKVRVLGMSLEQRKRQSSRSVDGNRAGITARAEARAHSGSGEEVYVLRGLKEDVLSVTELVNTAVHKALIEDLQDKKEAMLALTVQWSIQHTDGAWQELSLHDNYVLENAHINKQVSADVTAPDRMIAKVNLKSREAKNWQTGITYRVRRSETGATLELPAQWEPMHEEVFKKVELQLNSQEYQDVAQGFLKTAKYNIQKIERVQNLYLWHAYTVCRQRILGKNGLAELGEKSLYHGTSAESCNCIERDRFDRSFAGAHAAMYGKGVYFAVNADYSASRYSPPDTSGLRRLYVARVLTGRYTVGNSSMKAPPPRGSDPTDCFDSLVNNQQQPSMFVIFHDDQAYPEYLITFN